MVLHSCRHSDSFRPRQDSRAPPPTLDDIDVEALILSYKPILHPSVREGLADQYAVIEAARQDRETRLSPSDSQMSRSQSFSSTPSQLEPSSCLSSPADGPYAGRSHPRASTSSPVKSILKRSTNSSSSPSKPNFLSGEIAPEDPSSTFLQYVQPSKVHRRPSHASRTPSNLSNERSASPHSAGTSFMTGSIAFAPSRARATSFTSGSPLSTPPITAIPSRFTQATSPSVGPGSSCRHAEPNPFFAPPPSVSNTIAEMSPRSSLSSYKSNRSSLRWSSESCKTASTSRSISQPVSLTEVLEIKHRSPADIPHAEHSKAEKIEAFKPAGFSWLSFDEEGDVGTSESAPPMQRKNSLWRESLDSIASSHLDLLEQDKDDVRARDFPSPPMSRSNSIATTLTPEAEKRDPLEMQETVGIVKKMEPPKACSAGPSSLPGLMSSPRRKTSMSEMLRVHLVSPLGRNKSTRNGGSRGIEYIHRKDSMPFRNGSASSSSSTVVTK